jgi:hypothetical protein
MSSLETSFNKLRAQLGAVERLTPTHADPLYHFVHRPEETAELMRALPRWRACLEEDGWRVQIHSLAETLWSVIDASGDWEEWLTMEPDASPAEVRGAVRNALRTKEGNPNAGLAPAILDLISRQPEGRLLLLTDAGLLHPFFRVKAIESKLQNRLPCPTVIFYPGTKVGKFGLCFLGCYPEDPDYRSNIIGEDP